MKHILNQINIRIDEDIVLKLIDEQDADSIFKLIESNRVYLGNWLPWVDLSISVNDTKEYIRSSLKRYADNNGFDCVIFYYDQVIGQIGLHKIDHTSKSTSIGYWMCAPFQGHGIMTRSCKAMINYCFDELGLDIIEIKCASDNIRSRAIPERLQFKLVGEFHENEPISGMVRTFSLYVMKRAIWNNSNSIT